MRQISSFSDVDCYRSIVLWTIFKEYLSNVGPRFVDFCRIKFIGKGSFSVPTSQKDLSLFIIFVITLVFSVQNSFLCKHLCL